MIETTLVEGRVARPGSLLINRLLNKVLENSGILSCMTMRIPYRAMGVEISGHQKSSSNNIFPFDVF